MCITNFIFYISEITLQKFTEISIKDFNSYISRWLSNAGDRDGGKQQRNKNVITDEANHMT